MFSLIIFISLIIWICMIDAFEVNSARSLQTCCALYVICLCTCICIDFVSTCVNTWFSFWCEPGIREIKLQEGDWTVDLATVCHLASTWQWKKVFNFNWIRLKLKYAALILQNIQTDLAFSKNVRYSEWDLCALYILT